MSSVKENLHNIQEKIAPYKVKIIAVTKYYNEEKLLEAYEAGIRDFGENRVQDALAKIAKLPEEVKSNSFFHLIGHLQSNKVKKIVGKVDTIQSVDSVSIAKEIGKRSLEAGITTKILLEVNAGNEDSKFGFSHDELFEKACEISEIDGIMIDGLMCVAPICEKEAELRAVFSNMHRMFIDIGNKKMDNISMNVLSMGMSGDYKQAILEGANLVRVGSAIFGMRIYR